MADLMRILAVLVVVTLVLLIVQALFPWADCRQTLWECYGLF